MARIEWVRARLENWARWCAQQENSGLGYPTQTAFARLGGKGTRAEVALPILSLEAAETDQAVKSLQFSQSHLYQMLTLLYARGLPRHQVAIRMGRAESTIKRQLEDADHAIARWLQDRKAQADARKAAPVS
jgi:hypothetical protein